MGYELRLVTLEELPASWEMTRVAFGAEREAPPGWLGHRPGRLNWGIFDSGRLVAKATDREQGHWFGGRLVPACGIAGVAVEPELRGTGLAREVLTHLLTAARERGAVIATLFRTTPALYRRLGCEDVGALTWTAVPATSLAALQRPAEVTLRPAEPRDVPAVLEAYRTVARAGNGWLERSGPLFDNSPETVLSGQDGLSVAVGPDASVERLRELEPRAGVRRVRPDPRPRPDRPHGARHGCAALDARQLGCRRTDGRAAATGSRPGAAGRRVHGRARRVA